MKKKHICEIFFFFLNYVIKFRKILIKKKEKQSSTCLSESKCKASIRPCSRINSFCTSSIELNKGSNS